MRKPAFCIDENKDADQLRGNREADQRLFFATRILQSLFFLNPKFQTSSHLLWLHSPVCVGPCRKPRRPVFSQRGSYYLYFAFFTGTPIMALTDAVETLKYLYRMTQRNVDVALNLLTFYENALTAGKLYNIWMDCRLA